MQTRLVIIIIGLFIFWGHYLSGIFERKGIHDVLGLMLIATLPLQQSLPDGLIIQSICFSVILFSTLYCVALFTLQRLELANRFMLCFMVKIKMGTFKNIFNKIQYTL